MALLHNADMLSSGLQHIDNHACNKQVVFDTVLYMYCTSLLYVADILIKVVQRAVLESQRAALGSRLISLSEAVLIADSF